MLLKTTLSLLLFLPAISTFAQHTADSSHVWTFTYLKAMPGHRADLKEFIAKNWFAMDAVAQREGLIGRYELIENEASEGADWDIIVAVEYLTPNAYDDIATSFEKIRSRHTTIPVKGKVLKELGKIVKSEKVRRTINHQE